MAGFLVERNIVNIAHSSEQGSAINIRYTWFIDIIFFWLFVIYLLFYTENTRCYCEISNYLVGTTNLWKVTRRRRWQQYLSDRMITI